MAGIVFTTLGVAYIILDVIWTGALALGLAFLYRHRRLPFLQIRKIPLVFTAIIILHTYGFVATLGLTIGPVLPCDAQFWIMSIYLPLGMALLQAANSQFLHVARQQQKFASFNNLEDYELSGKLRPLDPSMNCWQRSMVKFKRMDKVTKILVYIGVGMVVQVSWLSLVEFRSHTILTI